MRRRQPTYSLSSSALDELSRVPRPPSTSTRGPDSDGDDGSERDSSSAKSAGGSSMEADSICSLDTFPRLNIGRLRPRTASVLAIQLGPLRWRLPHAVWRRRRRRRRRQQQQQLHAKGSGGEYRLPRSLRPSSMFHLRLRYSAMPGANHNKQTHRGSFAPAAAALMRGGLPGGTREESLCICADAPADGRAGGPAADGGPGLGNAAGLTVVASRMPFPFSPSLSSLAVGAETRHCFCFPSHLTQMLSPLAPATAPAGAPAEVRRPSASACRCAQQGGPRAPMTPCLQCYFRSSVVPRRGKFVHTQAGPVLDLTSCPVSAPLLGSWPSLSSNGTTATNQSSSQQSSGAASGLADPRTSTDTRGSTDSAMQIRLRTRPRTTAGKGSSAASVSSAAESHYTAQSVILPRPRTANAKTSSRASLASRRSPVAAMQQQQKRPPASPGHRLAAAVSLISSLTSELPPDDSGALRPPSPVSCSPSDASFVSLRDPATPSVSSLRSLGSPRTAAATPPGELSPLAPAATLPKRRCAPAYLRLVRSAAADGLAQLPSPPAASSAASSSASSSSVDDAAAAPAVPATPRSE
ncbi:hypothetical protein IWQ56_002791, partial [Coemansia nantahalensis]